MQIHRFRIPLNCGGILGFRTRERLYYDEGVLLLPDTYCAKGKPTRLVINCHGAGGTVSTDDAQIEGQTLTKYLLANGYALMDVNGLPLDFAEEEGIDIRNNIGSPLATESYVAAYRYCTENFNLYPDVFVHGGSMGGISSTNLVLSGRIPVIAQSGFCPVLDTYHQIYKNPWSGGLPKVALGKLYRLEKDENGEYIYDEEKIAPNNPMGRAVSSDTGETLAYPVPVSFWQCEDDATVCIDITRRFVAAVARAGGTAILHTFETGGHEPQDCGAPLPAPSGNTDFAGTSLAILPAVEGVFQWIKQFDF